MGMTRAVAILASALIAALAFSTQAGAGDRDGYRGYVGLADDPTHEASQGAGWTANFRESKPGSIAYRVCLKHRDEPEVKRCWRRETGGDGRSAVFVALYVNDVGGPGRWRAKWKVDGRKVETWGFRVISEGV
jgi:hypothetical protein